MKTTEFLKENDFIGHDAHHMHEDHQHQMLREECYHLAVNSVALHKLLGQLDDAQVLDAWAAEKISLANDYIKTVKEWLEYEVMSDEGSEVPAFAMESAEQQYERILEASGDQPKSKPAVVKTNKPIGSRVADIGPGGKEYNVKTDKAWDDQHKKVDEGSLDDNAIWNQYGHYNTQDLMQEFPNISPKDAESIVSNAERGWTDPTYKQKYRDNVVKLVKMAMSQQGVAEAKGLNKRVEVIKGPHAGQQGTVRQVKHGAFKGAPKSFFVDLDDGTQFDNVPGSTLRLIKDIDEGDTNFGSTVTHGSWVVYDGSKVKRFKTRDGAKAYAEKNGGKVASSEFYADNIQGKQSVDEKKGHGEIDPLAARADYAKRHGTGQVYKKTYPGDKDGMSKAYAYDIKRTGPKGVLPEEDIAEGEQRMSRAAKGIEKYGKDGMKALAKAGREGASEKKLDAIRDKHDKYNEGWTGTVGFPPEGNHTGNQPPVSIGGTFAKRPEVKEGSLVKAEGLSGVWRVERIRGEDADITMEIPNTAKSTRVPVKELRVWTNKPVMKEDATGGATGSFSVAATVETLGDKGSFSKKDVDRRLKGYSNVISRPGIVKVKAPK